MWMTNGNQGINWRKSTGQCVETYTAMLQSDCDLVTIGNCTYPSVESIDQVYAILSERVIKYASESMPKRKYVSYLKPYWNADLSTASKYMKHVRWQWGCAGRPRDPNNYAYEQYKTAKCDFRRLHRKAVTSYLNSLNDDIDWCAGVDSCRFWKLVNSRRKSELKSWCRDQLYW